MALNNPYTAHALRAYHNFQSKQANSITLFRRRPNNKQFSPLKRKSRKAWFEEYSRFCRKILPNWDCPFANSQKNC